MKEQLKDRIREIIKESKEHNSDKCTISLPGKYHDMCYTIMEELQEENLFKRYLDSNILIGSHHPEGIYNDYTITIPDPNTSLIIFIFF